jgi:hypothetical protein
MKPTVLQPAEYSVTSYSHTPSAGEGIEDALKPEYWSHVASSLRVGNRIELLSEDGSWWAMLIVRAASKTDAVVQALQYVPLGADAVDLGDAPYEVRWRGPKAKFGVVRKSDAEVMRDGFAVREHAEAWMVSHLRTLAA